MKTDWWNRPARHKHHWAFKHGYGTICIECGRHHPREIHGSKYPVDYTNDEALHPFVGETDICGGCGEHRNWHKKPLGAP